MPLTVEAPHPGRPAPDAVVIGLINNMPDAALEATEVQFRSLLGTAAAAFKVRLRFSFLPEVPREAQAAQRLCTSYWPIDGLLASRPDALIVTGTEPRSADLEDEPYWPRLVQLVAWARAHTLSSVWSCLAAHAVVQALDGIRRRPLPEKRFGVFAHRPLEPCALLRGIKAPLMTPHSRWNELPVQALRDAGYTIASGSVENGVDLFVKRERSVLLGFQGHPEYEALTLLKEYRRDVGRFLSGAQARWPTLPAGYLSPAALAEISAFRARAETSREPSLLRKFPTARLSEGIQAVWRTTAVQIYRNWLTHLATVKGCTPHAATSRHDTILHEHHS